MAGYDVTAEDEPESVTPSTSPPRVELAQWAREPRKYRVNRTLFAA